MHSESICFRVYRYAYGVVINRPSVSFTLFLYLRLHFSHHHDHVVVICMSQEVGFLVLTLKEGEPITRKTERVLDKKVTRKTEEYVDELTGDTKIRTVEYVSKVIETEVYSTPIPTWHESFTHAP